MSVSTERCAGRMKTIALCERRPTVEREGKHYCWQHDPERISRKAQKARQQLYAKMSADDAEHAERIRYRRLAIEADMENVTADELEAIASLGGLRALLSLHRKGAV